MGDDMGDAIPDFSPIAVDKSAGETSFPLPAVPSAVNGSPSTPIETEFSSAASISIPA